MSEIAGGPPAFELVSERYRQGKCPCCGKARGEPRGLEYRPKANDLYCRTCKKQWPLELDLNDLRREISLAASSAPNSCGREVFYQAPRRNIVEFQTEIRGLRRFLKRIVLRR